MLFRRVLLAILTSLLFYASSAKAFDAPADLLASGKVDEAIQALNGVIATQPYSSRSYGLLCRAYFSLSQWDRAISACEKAISIDQNSAEFHLWLARAYGEKADAAGLFSAASLAKKSRAEFEKATGLDPFSAEAHTDLAEFYFEAPSIVGGGKDKARAQADLLAKISPTHERWVRGRIAEKEKNNADAEKEYRAMIDASHGSAWSWLSLGQFYKHNNQLDPMEEALQHVLTAPIDRPESLVDAASMLYKTDRNLPLATELLRRYLKDKGNEQAPIYKAHFLLGNILEKQGDRAGAVAEYRSVLALVGGFRPAQDALKRLNA